MPKCHGLLTPIWIVDTTSPKWREELYEILNFEPGPRPSELHYRGDGPFLLILQTAIEKLSARFIVVEDYISTDYADEFAAHHSRVLQAPPRIAKRLHFFAEPRDLADNKSQSAFLSETDVVFLRDSLRNSYLGYSVVRPLHGFRVGDTVIVSPHMKGGADLVHCQAPFQSTLLGNQLQVVGHPFIQQDTQVTICAEAALWSIARYMHQIGETRRYRPSEITDLAKSHVTIGATREGLTEVQIVDALRLMNLSPHLIFPANKKDAVELIYSCVESELPVIVSIPSHVQIVIGHDFADNLSAPCGKVTSLSECVTKFIVHDDATGPYLKLEVKEGMTPEGRNYLELGPNRVMACIVALPPRVHMRGDDATWIARSWLSVLGGLLPEWKTVSTNDLVLRTYLRRCDCFKKDVLRQSESKPGMARQFAGVYRSAFLPKYVWIIELAYRQDIENVRPEDRLIRGEIVIDASSAPYDAEYAVIAAHLDGRLLIRRNLPSEEPQFAQVGPITEPPYLPLRRSIRHAQTGV